MVLFTPSPKSYYRVQQFDDLETAKWFCEGYAAVPDVQFYLCLIICDATWQSTADAMAALGARGPRVEHARCRYKNSGLMFQHRTRTERCW